MRHKRSIGEYLAFLAVKYTVDPEKFLYALRHAEEHRKSRCNKISIMRRGKVKDKFMFLIMRGSEVVAHFPIEEEFLLNKRNELKNFMQTDNIRKYMAKKDRASTPKFINDLKTGMTNISLKAEVLEIGEPKRVVTKYGNMANVAKVLIGDETGTIMLCLWNGQIGDLSVGDSIQIENAQASMFKGERLLSLGRKGTLNSEVKEWKTGSKRDTGGQDKVCRPLSN